MGRQIKYNLNRIVSNFGIQARESFMKIKILLFFFFLSAFAAVTFSQIQANERYYQLAAGPQIVSNRSYDSNPGTAVSEAVGSASGVLTVSANALCTTSIIIPDTIILEFSNNAKIIKQTGCTIEFQGVGLANPVSRAAAFEGFAVGDITFTGSIYPSEISTELWDTGNTSLTDRVARADAALSGKAATIIAYPRVITNNAEITAKHNLLFMPGEYTNTLNTRGTTNLPAFTLNDDTSAIGKPGAKIYQGPTNNGYLFYAKHMVVTGANGTNSNIRIEGIHFLPSATTTDGAPISIVTLGNTKNGRIVNNIFDRTFDYVCVGGFGDTGNYADGNYIVGNTFRGIATQVIGLINSKHTYVTDNIFDQRNDNGSGTYSVIDAEPNSPNEWVDDTVIARNEFTFDGTTAAAEYKSAITAQNRVRRIYVFDNKIIGTDFSLTDTGSLTYGINFINVEIGEIYNNYIQATVQSGIGLNNCRFLKVSNNRLIQIGDASGTGAAIGLYSVADSQIDNNTFLASWTPVTQSQGIFEAEQEKLVTTSGSTVTSGQSFPAFQPHWYGLKVVINATEYTVSTINHTANPQTLTTTAAVGTLTAKTAASATDVNTGTDTITLGSHNFVNNARLRYTAGTAAIGGLTNGQTVFVVGATGTTIQVAATPGGSPINLTSTGTGTQTFSPLLVTRFSNNVYRANHAPGGVTLETTGTSSFAGVDDRTLTASGTTGAQTIRKPAFTVNFAAGATSLVVTNALVNGNTGAICQVLTNDATMFAVKAVAATGTLTLYPNAAPTAETKVYCEVKN